MSVETGSSALSLIRNAGRRAAWRGIVTVLALTLAVAPAGAQAFRGPSTFDLTPDGWTCPAVGPLGPGCPSAGVVCWGCPAPHCITPFPSGPCGDDDACAVPYANRPGNPGGYLWFRDTGSGRPFVKAPSTYHGSWLAADGDGEIRFDHAVFQANTTLGGATPRQYEVILQGKDPAGGLLEFIWQGSNVALSPLAGCPNRDASTGGWITVSVPLDQAHWTQLSGTGSWLDLLTDVQGLWIRAELVSQQANPDHEGIDNVIVIDR